MKRIEAILLFTIYLFVNYLFIYKYGIRQNYINKFVLIIAYTGLIFTFFYFLNRTTLKNSTLKIIYFSTVILFFLFTILMNYYIDEANINVDRWSAMETSISALFNNKYPYDALDHLNGRSSNLPGLFIIGMPFYLMGNIGLLQSFSFLLFSFTVYRTINNLKAKLLCLFLFIFSVSFLWEVYVKSDLMSNFIIMNSFISLWYIKYKNDSLKKTELLAIISSLLLFTRLVSIIPLTLLIFKPFINSPFSKQLKYIISSILTLFALASVVLLNCPSIEYFIKFNPITLQNRQLPFLISLVIVIIPFFYSKKIHSLDSLIKYSLFFLFIPVFLSFLISNYKYGILKIIESSVFDISYFNIAMPFLIYFIAIKYNNYSIKDVD